MNLTNDYKFFLKNGYIVIDLLKKDDLNIIIKAICKKFNDSIPNEKKKFFFNKDNIKNYHNLSFVKKNHEELINSSKRYIFLDKKILNKVKKNKNISSIMLNYWGHDKFTPKWVGSIHQIKDNAAGFRIARPNKLKIQDAAGSHSDINVGGKIANDHKILITAWVPLIGFNKKYTLRFAPLTHLIDHPYKAVIKQKKHMSRVLSENYLKKFKFKRLNLKKGQAIFFHPNLIHGGSVNMGSNTRLSIEIRMFNKINALKFSNQLRSS